jgi:predicted  nucleic acid-binding Zn-ribbon protein
MLLALPFLFLYNKIALAIGYHNHKCLVCGAVWTHADGSPMSAHYCPYCKNGPFTIQSGESARGPRKIFQTPKAVPTQKLPVVKPLDFKILGK